MSEEAVTLHPGAPEAEQLNRLFAFARDLRGALIDQAIWIDVILTEILARYFVPDEGKRMLFSSDVLTGSDSSFSGRIAVLRKVVSRSYAAFQEAYPDFFDRLDKIRRFRNRLAHAHLDTSDAFVAKAHVDRIQLVFYEDGVTKTQVVTADECRSRLAECSEVVRQLVELRKLVEGSA